MGDWSFDALSLASQHQSVLKLVWLLRFLFSRWGSHREFDLGDFFTYSPLASWKLKCHEKQLKNCSYWYIIGIILDTKYAWFSQSMWFAKQWKGEQILGQVIGHVSMAFFPPVTSPSVFEDIVGAALIWFETSTETTLRKYCGSTVGYPANTGGDWNRPNWRG